MSAAALVVASSVPAIALAVIATAVSVLALAGSAARRGLADDPSTAPHRKLQDRPVPAVGGAAILVGLLVAGASRGALVPGGAIGSALLLAFALGFTDDRTPGGLPPFGLLLGQSIVAAALLASGWRVCGGDSTLAVAASFFAAVLALNCVNSFDNADGAATALGILGLSAGSPLLAAPLLGFLPFNLWLRRGKSPVAYLGNSGSHVLGVLMLLDPIGRAALLLPLLDLARLSFTRLAVGSRPWVGDRRHLAHRLQRAGFEPSIVVLALLAVAAPAVIGALCARDSLGGPSDPRLLAIGLAMSAALFAVAVFLTPRVD